MSLLWQRRARLTAGTTEVEGLRTAFRIRKTLTKSPNAAEVRVYNLTESTRESLSQYAQGVPVELVVGYAEGEEAAAFSGEMRTVVHTREGPDWVTILTSGDGDRALNIQRISKAWRKGADITGVVGDIVEAAGVGVGNAIEQAKRGDLAGAGRLLTEGLTLSGSAGDAMEQAMAGLDLEWSIQDGEVLALRTQEAIGDQIVLLSPDSGLVGVPAAAEEGRVQARALIQPGLAPGRRLQLQSRTMSGVYRIEVVDWRGDTHGPDWYCDLELGEVR